MRFFGWRFKIDRCFLFFSFLCCFFCFLVKYLGALSEGAWAATHRCEEMEIKSV